MREDERLRYVSFVGARYPSLYRTAYLLTGDLDSAQDLVESALVTVYLSWGRGEAKDHPEARARRVLASQFVSSRRRRRREVGPARPTDLATATTEDGPVGRVVDRLTVWEQLGRLTARQRAVVVLRYHEGLSETEIAASLGIAPRTVQGHDRAALRWLRSMQPSRSLPEVPQPWAPSRYERP